MRPPRLLLTVLVALFAGIGAAGSASAAITVTYAGTTATISGTGDNFTFVGFTTTYVPTGTVTIRNGSGMTNATGGLCATETQPVFGTTIHCPAATTTVQASFGAGNDRFMLDGVCVPSTVVALGEGSNSFEQNWTGSCPPDTTATVTGGSGADQIVGGVGDDHLDGGGGPDEIRGGAGNDTIVGGDGNDDLSGEAGNDVVLGGTGDDKLKGGEGSDLLDGGDGNDVVGQGDPNPGADDLRGGSGHDELWYADHAPGITVTLDGVANDGSAGESDNVHADFERYVLSPGDDVFVGSPGRDVVDGWSGNDLLRGGDGQDELTGGSGNDQLFGEGGDDLLLGDGGDDVVDGGPGRDSLFGDSRDCSVYSCPAGADRLIARDGELDTVSCGAGPDIAVVDAVDVVAGDGFQACESIDRAAAVAPPGGGGPAGGGGAAKVAPAPFTKAKLTGARRAFTLRLTLRKAATVSVTVTRSGARKALGTVRYRVKKSGRFTRTVRKIRGKTLRRGSYRVVVKVGSRSQTLKVQVR